MVYEDIRTPKEVVIIGKFKKDSNGNMSMSLPSEESNLIDPDKSYEVRIMLGRNILDVKHFKKSGKVMIKYW